MAGYENNSKKRDKMPTGFKPIKPQLSEKERPLPTFHQNTLPPWGRNYFLAQLGLNIPFLNPVFLDFIEEGPVAYFEQFRCMRMVPFCLFKSLLYQIDLHGLGGLFD